jgi:hypothetical protein
MSSFDSHLWFSDAIRYFRGFGFFASHAGSDNELGEAIKAYWHGDWDEFLAGVRDLPSADQFLLVADMKRVCWHDLEGVYRGANCYVEVLNEWAAISQGLFLPEQIQETWQGDNGPADVTFLLDGKKHTFIHRSGDFLEHGILQIINQTLARTSFRFEVATDYGDSNWIALLDQDEKKRLKTERGWHFLW